MEKAVVSAKARRLRVALIGNPNVGKTVIFNKLTGGRAHVGNWPGVTVERKVGKYRFRDVVVEVVDLPGVYSLTPYSLDEKIARDYILEEKPDVVVDIVDASNLERNLYLTLELLEAGANVVVALNMIDEAESKGLIVDHEKLSRILGVPVVPMIAIKGVGFSELKEAILKAAGERREGLKVDYGAKAEEFIRILAGEMAGRPGLEKYEPRWLAIKLLENDDDIIEKLRDMGYSDLVEKAERVRERFRVEIGEPEIYFASKRYETIKSIVEAVVARGRPRFTLSDLLDEVALHKVFGIPVFLALMWMMFQFTFRVSAPFSDAIDAFFAWLGGLAASKISNPHLASFIGDGVISGLGAVLVFVPPIFLLFFLLSLMEDSGYMARAAFVMDRVFYRLGLSGRVSIPLLLGFGCNVPAIMATRTIKEWRDRLITILITPLMSCSARFTVYVLFAGAFFPGREGTVVFSLYILGLGLALALAYVFGRTLFKGQPSPLIMEVPPYRMPSLKVIAGLVWERGSVFLKNAGTVILLGVTLVWFLGTYPGGPGSSVESSYIAAIGRKLEPLLAPLGWDWRAAVALIFGFVAKETIIAALGTLYGLSDASAESVSLRLILHQSFTPLTAYAYMAFVLIYTPCLATVAAIRQETGSWKWTAFAVAYELALAYTIALAIVGAGRLLGLA